MSWDIDWEDLERALRSDPRPKRDTRSDPAAICDACEKSTFDNWMVGKPCYYCHAGVFMDRAFWHWHREGIDTVVWPLADVTEEDVRDAIDERRRK